MDLPKILKDFFCTYLKEQRALSPNTLKSYRDTFKILFTYLSSQQRTARPIALADLDVKTILAFLQHLEDPTRGRSNCAKTRNQRLAAIQSFFWYLSLHYPVTEKHAKRIFGIPVKKAQTAVASFLTRQELDILMAQPNIASSDGVRDLALLNFLYNTGARASEAAEAQLSWFDFPNRLVIITGKGNKIRENPLWPATVRLLKQYLDHHRRKPKPEAAAYFFISQRGLPFTRFGIRSIVKRYVRCAIRQCPDLAKKRISTHSLRHTTASHLLESATEPTVVKYWLGHSRKTKSDTYTHVDLNYKRRILERLAPPHYVTSVEEQGKTLSQGNSLNWMEDF